MLAQARARRFWVAITLATVVGAGLALRLYHLDNFSLWLDETYQYFHSTGPSTDIYRTEGLENMFLTYLMSHFLISAGWNSVWALRLPAAILGTAEVGALYLLAREAWGQKREAFSAAVLAVGWPVLVVYSQEFRPYSLFALLSTLSLWSLLMALRTGHKAAWLGFALTSLLEAYNHWEGLVNVASMIFAGFLYIGLDPTYWHRRLEDRAWVSRLEGLGAASCVVAIGMLPFVGKFIAFRSSTQLLMDPSKLHLTAHNLSQLFGDYLGLGQGVPLVLLVSLGLLGAARVAWTKLHILPLLMAWFAVPLIVASVQPGGATLLAVSRYVIFMAPVYICLIVGGAWSADFALRRLHWPGRGWLAGTASTALVALVAGLEVPQVAEAFVHNPKPYKADLRTAYIDLLTGLRPNDLVLEASSASYGSVYWFPFYDSYFLRVHPAAPVVVVEPINFGARLPELRRATGRLWMIVTIREAEKAKLLQAGAGRYQRECVPEICLLWDNGQGPMSARVANFLESYSYLDQHDFEGPRLLMKQQR